MRATRLVVATVCGRLLLSAGLVAAEPAPSSAAGEVEAPAVTNLAQLRLLASRQPARSFVIRLEGDVWWASPAQGRLVLRDESGAEELEVELGGQAAQAGSRVRLEGQGTIARRGAGFRLGARGAVVDNDGLHGMIEKAGSVYLTAGRHPLQLDWFNGVEKFGLDVEYDGPGVVRQHIPDTALFHATRDASGASNVVQGLECATYEGEWEKLPDLSSLASAKVSTVPNFVLSGRTRDEHVGLRFSGLLEVPRTGLYTFHLVSDDGSLLYVGEPAFHLTVLGPAGPRPPPRPLAIGQTLQPGEDGVIAVVEGKVTLVRPQSWGVQFELSAGAGRIRAELAEPRALPALALNNRVRATGFCQSALTTDGERAPGVLLVPRGEDVELIETPPDQVPAGPDGGLPVLTRASEVHRLKREEAQRGYRVKIRGVVTSVWPEHQAFTLEDSTRGLYIVDLSTNRTGPPGIGEQLEIDGASDALFFAPIVNAQRVTSLGAGVLPTPIQPTWDQLMNGSLDAQYVELEGIVTGVQPDGVTLRTGGGSLKVGLQVTGLRPEELKRYEHALVRVRGCLFASWDYVTHQVKVGEVRIHDADVKVEQPAPADLFASPAKSPAELLLFDPQASAFQRVKVSGQIVHVREGEYFMMNGSAGLRFIPTQPPELQAGDLVEVVGFPEISGGASPVLREAVARKTGHLPLPEPRQVPAEGLLRADYDATRVRLEGLLVSARNTASGEVLELQNRARTFVARLDAAPDERLRSLSAGSRLELVGVYAAQGGDRATGQGIASFELLCNSPADIRVLARPPWWTLERLVVIVGALACVLAMSALWIKQLHRKVEERTAQLEAQIRERQRVEHQRAMEQERARVAQDLHDELGSGLTEIGMLAERARSGSAPEERRSGHLAQVGEKARELVTALDEIVWAMNPGHDSLTSLVSYLCLYADRFLGLANIAWRLEGAPVQEDHHVLDSRRRHQLFLAFKEALTNIVRHSGATEVRLGVQVEHGEVRLSIRDNGRGLSQVARTESMDGVANMRARLEKIGGRFEISSEPGRGAVLQFSVPSN